MLAARPRCLPDGGTGLHFVVFQPNQGEGRLKVLWLICPLSLDEVLETNETLVTERKRRVCTSSA